MAKKSGIDRSSDVDGAITVAAGVLITIARTLRAQAREQARLR